MSLPLLDYLSRLPVNSTHRRNFAIPIGGQHVVPQQEECLQSFVYSGLQGKNKCSAMQVVRLWFAAHRKNNDLKKSEVLNQETKKNKSERNIWAKKRTVWISKRASVCVLTYILVNCYTLLVNESSTTTVVMYTTINHKQNVLLPNDPTFQQSFVENCAKSSRIIFLTRLLGMQVKQIIMLVATGQILYYQAQYMSSMNTCSLRQVAAD